MLSNAAWKGDPVRAFLPSLVLKSMTFTLRKRFARAISEGDLASDTDPADLARFVATVSHGMAVQADGGGLRDKLRRVAEMALQARPT